MRKCYVPGMMVNTWNTAVRKTHDLYSHEAYILMRMILYLNLYCIFITEV